MKIVVYTALLGPLAPRSLPTAPADSNAHFICFTDVSCKRADGWDQYLTETPSNPRLASRFIKLSSECFDSYDVSIWMDGTFRWRVPPEEAVAAALQITHGGVVGFAHPDRHRMVDEALVVAKHDLAPASEVQRQLQHYQAQGFDTTAAPLKTLTTTGLLLRWQNPTVAEFNDLWRQQVFQYTWRDQLSVDYVAWRRGLTIGYLPGHYRSNAFVEYDRSRRPRPYVAAP